MFYNDTVFYSVSNTTYIGNQYYKLGDMFRFTEPFSGQFLKQSNSTFSACAHMGSHRVHTFIVPCICSALA